MEQIINNLKEQFNRLETLILTHTGKKVLTLEETVIYTGLSKSYLYKLTSSRKIPHYKPHGKHLYFDREELEQWLLQNRSKTNKEIEMEALDYLVKHDK